MRRLTTSIEVYGLEEEVWYMIYFATGVRVCLATGVASKR